MTDLYFTYANTAKAKASISANDYSNMILLDFNKICSTESGPTNNINDFDACMDLCSFDQSCNYVSYNNNSCIMTSDCSYIDDSEHDVYVKASELQKIINGSPETESDPQKLFDYLNITVLSVVITLAIIIILYLYS